MGNYIVLPLFWGGFHGPTGDATGAVPQPWPFSADQMRSSLSQVSDAGYYTGLAEYGCGAVFTWDWSWVDSNIPPTFFDPAQGFTSAFLQQTLMNLILGDQIPPSTASFGGPTPIYLWVMAHGTFNSSQPGANGAHFIGPAPANVIWAWIYQGDSLDDTMINATHEIVEAIGKDLGQQELCDRCQDIGQRERPRIAGWPVEPYFSVHKHACIVPGVLEIFQLAEGVPHLPIIGIHPDIEREEFQ